MKTLTISTLLAASLVVLAACDQTTTGDPSLQTPQVSFEAADTNGDGHITTQEALAVPSLDFSRMDADGNQSVTPQEFATAMALSRTRG